MKKTIYHLIFYSFLCFFALLFSCTEETIKPPDDDGGFQLPPGIAGLTSFKYEYLGKAPIHTQTSMLTGYQNRLYRFGSEWPIQILDLTTSEWELIPVNDSSFQRWDGAAVTIGDSIFVIATRDYFSQLRDILKFDLITTSFERTFVDLPGKFAYPAYCIRENTIFFFSQGTDSVYEFNTENRYLIKVADNPFYNNLTPNQNLSSGRYLNYFYIFGGYHRLPKNIFYKLNLDTYLWESLVVPPIIEDKFLIGSVLGSSMFLLCDSASTYEYSFIEDRWYLDTSKVPVFPRYLTGQLFQTEWSFFSQDSCLYGTEVSSEKVWKIAK